MHQLGFSYTCARKTCPFLLDAGGCTVSCNPGRQVQQAANNKSASCTHRLDPSFIPGLTGLVEFSVCEDCPIQIAPASSTVTFTPRLHNEAKMKQTG